SVPPFNFVTVQLNNGEGILAWTISGLTVSGATLTSEVSNDGGATWSAAPLVASGGGISTTITKDDQYRLNTAGRTSVRLRVSTLGVGSITTAWNASSVSGLNEPLPQLGAVTPGQSAAAEGHHVFKVGSGLLYGLSVTIGATRGWVMLFDSATVPADG